MTLEQFDALVAEWWQLRQSLALGPIEDGDDEDAMDEASDRKRDVTMMLAATDVAGRCDELLEIAAAMSRDDDDMGREKPHLTWCVIEAARKMLRRK